MDAIFGFLKLVFFLVIIAVGVVIWRYNGLRRLSEDVKEAWSNIGVSVRKQASLINQLIDAVRNYSEGEKLVMLKVSEDNSLGNVQQLHQQGGTMLSTVTGLAQRFPDLKADTQYLNLMDAIQDVENKLETQRQKYNATAKRYNVLRTTIPDVFYASLIGFKAAPYLDFDDTSAQQGQTLKDFASDDGERINQLLSDAGSKVLRVSQQVGASALQHGKQIANAAQEKAKELRLEYQQTQQSPGELLLIDIGGSAAGKSFPLQQSGQVIGRADSVQIVVKDEQVAERHLWLGQEDGRWLLRDLSSPQGTFVNDNLEQSVSEIEIQPEQVISLGKHGDTRFKVVLQT
ncbi:hypothetical protein AGMMS49545_22480 [Betaproteobacteria bacterium]|nr:hypothetical protein AGMMS49545_22450 [Betaproteobacteria bacterium]GHT96724.1 hypothetical protein AGMMS49545_22480 [Betaproteobacteria bacterium]